MTPVNTVEEVFRGIQEVKTGAGAFATNFFPAQGRLQGWIDHQELFWEVRDRVAFFFRRDRDFWHLHFCAAEPQAIPRALADLPGLSTERVVTDLIGSESGLSNLVKTFQDAGFHHYKRLVRLARPSQPAAERRADTSPAQVTCATPDDAEAALQLLETSFDRYADQIPTLYEIQAAIENRQILAVKAGTTLAGLLFFETQGFTSTIRYWVVAEAFQAYRFGSALMRHYLEGQMGARRFLLWVGADNENALHKYGHYGYRADGLADLILVNSMIS